MKQPSIFIPEGDILDCGIVNMHTGGITPKKRKKYLGFKVRYYVLKSDNTKMDA